jgi:class 3 adenylate cyclase
VDRSRSRSRLRLRAIGFLEVAPSAAPDAAELLDAVAQAGGEPVQIVQRLGIVAFDSARRALELAASLPPGVRAGFSVGDVLFESEAIHGLPVIEASRLRERARFGQVLCAARLVRLAPEAASQFREVGAVPLEGFALPIAAYERAALSAPARPRRGAPRVRRAREGGGAR